MPRGQIVYGRYPGHHIAGMVWHRDDREGHDDGRVWWSHHLREWVSWGQVQAQVVKNNLVLIPLLPPGYVAGFNHTEPDGMCNEGCSGWATRDEDA